jgi:hypothetical protein
MFQKLSLDDIIFVPRDVPLSLESLSIISLIYHLFLAKTIICDINCLVTLWSFFAPTILYPFSYVFHFSFSASKDIELNFWPISSIRIGIFYS